MGGPSGHRAIETADDWLRSAEKRMLREERRPLIRRASDLMGPSLGPYTQQVMDWNGVQSSYNGMLYSPVGALNSPDIDYPWIGLNLVTAEGQGMQHVWAYDTTLSSVSLEYHRLMGNRLWGPWLPLQEPWHEVGGDGEAGFENGWANYSDTAATAAYRREGNLILLKGRVATTGTVTATIFTLPEGYRPIANELHLGIAAMTITVGTETVTIPQTGVRVNITQGGAVSVDQPGVYASSLSLSGITFSVT